MNNKKTETAVLGGGCFWCIEAVFRRIPGIISVTAGYAGGSREKPDYAQVCSGLTGHAEVVRLEYDPEQISYAAILDIFFAAHDPTTINRQGADTGPQYRSVILYGDDTQKETAEKKIAELAVSGKFKRDIVTEVLPLEHFWEAEGEHQDYFEKHPYAGYCRVVIQPKIDKLRLPGRA
ncbi:peptide-methionine (S)-S-oxide reductase MsrA [Breznakiella homolactica]|uniref:Peptide methionine sulfoxide reductase MsrA n=1 Tax=Breznakiella homolactica TaxID=2798577 RepID=A0A7T7XL26_9SPIR|nr:peptide-methionine (S)-S-oxide reductase MsrA [Breznakiella homolactica]QQO08364.1 peptide-methionine (S)-S-oxide reductase MsrA [Breznakiella homolactica]